MSAAPPANPRRAWFVLAGLLLLVLTATLVASLTVLRLTTGPDPADAVDHRPAGVPADAEVAVVTRIVDGDTIRIAVRPGQDDTDSIRVRLLNIDAPELARDGTPAECLATAATDRVATLLTPGEVVWLAGDVEDRDRFDRLLRGVWTGDGVFVNEVLADEGLARSLLIAPNDRFHATIVAAERRAQTAARGIWGAACNGS